MTVSVWRASQRRGVGLLSGIIRYRSPGSGRPCPVEPGTEVALASPAKAIAALRCAAAAAGPAWGGRTAVTMPAPTVTAADMAAALAEVAGPQVSTLIDWAPDAAVARIVAGCPPGSGPNSLPARPTRTPTSPRSSGRTSPSPARRVKAPG